ncbi:low temperature requirement protein A [Pseudodonghicola sp.]|uniref:low temperature requirement protein A n=1 Tax=Pseudodonghicola sp. TaxID=1969463 RepID=UPI003A986E47
MSLFLMIRPLRPRDPHEHHRAATQLELFFDLISVIAIAAITAAFHHAISAHHGAEMLPNFLFLFFATWWVWLNHTWYSSAFDNDDALSRVLTFVIMAGFLLFAAGAERIFETMDFGYGLWGWVIMRLGMAGLWLRVAKSAPDYRGTALRYAVGILFAQALWCLLYFSTPPGGAAFFAGGIAIFLVELAVPALAERHKATSWHRHHIIERYGLLNIIILGEILLSISFMMEPLYSHGFDWALISAAGASLLIVFSLWWLYFLEAEHLVSNRLSTALIWGYGHVIVFFAGALLAAGFGAAFDVISHHSEITADQAGQYVAAAIALYFAGLWLVRDRVMPGGWVLLPATALALWGAVAGVALWPVAALCLATLVLRGWLGAR